MAMFGLIIVFCISVAKDVATETGPYELKLVSLSLVCIKPPLPKIPRETIILKGELYNTTGNTLFRGNATILRNLSNIKISGQYYVKENGTWKVIYKVPGLSCQRSIYRMIGVALNIRIDYSSCGTKKGRFYFNGVNIAKLVHFWQQEAEYGPGLIKFQIIDSKYTLVCVDTEFMVIPAKKSVK